MKRLFTITLVASLMLLAASVMAQDDAPLKLADILKAAECPMSDEQTKQLAGFSMDNPDSFMMLNELFNEDQTKALMETFGTQEGGFGDMPPQPRGLFFLIMFENGGKPVTKAQAAKIKALEDGDMMTVMQDMMAIFTEDQMALMPQMGGF